MIELRSILLSLATYILLLPCYAALFFLIRPAVQLAMPIFQLAANTHFAWPPGSQFLNPCSVPLDQFMPFCDAMIRVSRYRKGSERVKCVFCLCHIEEGEEIRELRCRHLFHRSCLDGWLELGRSTCPLCRLSLFPAGANAQAAEMTGGGIGDSSMDYVPYVDSDWWN